MRTADNHEYFTARERHAREMAEKASDPAARHAHLQMAQFYADRARLHARVEQAA